MAEGTTRLSGISYRYSVRGPWALREVDFALEPGVITRIVGANGSGKSTLMRILAGACRPTRGRISALPRAGYVPGTFPGLPFTTIGYLGRSGRVRGLSEQEAVERSDQWLDRFGALEFRDQPLFDLSRGSAQKIGIIQALLAEPRMLVLDEAWTGLDADAQGQLDEVVLDCARSGRKVVFVDHEPTRLAAAVGSAYFCEAGRLRQVPATPALAGLVEAVEAADESTEAADESTEPRPAGTGRMIIDLEGAPDPWPGPGTGRRLPNGVLRLESEQSGSDDLLRELLREHPGVHVRSIKEAL
jgi:ABC-2 type transport system ATP-binding protein